MESLPAYERDPYLARLTTAVRSAGARDGRPYVVLEDTIFYPEGGGQPGDRGTVGGVLVADVQREAGEIRHYLDGAAPAGPVTLELDWRRRFDHMQSHTAQHLLTALAQDRFGWPTTAFHLGEERCDIELDAPVLPKDELAALEEMVAAEIRAARPVGVRRVAPAELGGLDVRTRGLPEGHTGDVRLVEILGIDRNTCGGTHLRSTAEIEAVKLLDTEPMRGGTRLHFVAGRRLRARLAAHEERAATLRTLLGAPDDELAAAAQGKLEQLKDALRRTRQLDEELAGAAAQALAGDAEPVVAAHWDDKDGGFLQRVAKELVALAPAKVALLTAGPGDAGLYVVCGGAEAPVDLAALSRDAARRLDGKGGGAGRIFQGKAAALSRRAQLVQQFASAWPR